MTAALPRTRRAVDEHWCASCRECDSCRGGRAPFPRAWVPHIGPTGACRALCADCGGVGILCPALDRQARP